MFGVYPPAPGRPTVQHSAVAGLPGSLQWWVPAHLCPVHSLWYPGSVQPWLQLEHCACSAHQPECFQQPGSGGMGRKQLLFLTCLISTLPRQCTSALLRVHSSHLSQGLQESPAHTGGISSSSSSWDILSKDLFHKPLFPQPMTKPLALTHSLGYLMLPWHLP